ncbi:glycosyltransferase [Kiloniella majae]|uniref:glycosyltransferase n=1 Tax=Kiloniella majae TaxID=1938558 RepID=UPI000A27897B|nr:glycosyltransferase [Kiloniella majae]
MQNQPVTIITPVYNCADYIVETVESVLAQGHKALEYIVIDDGSSDETLSLLKPFADRLTLISHTNIGEQATVNKGIAMAANDIVAIVNADDPILPGLIEESLSRLTANADLVGVYPDWLKTNAYGEVIEKNVTLDYDYGLMLDQCYCIPGPGAFFRKSALHGEKPRNLSYRFSGDFDMWLRLGLVGEMERIPKFLATWRWHEGGASQAQRSVEMAENKVDVMQALFDRVDFPNTLAAHRAQAMSSSYYAAGLLAIHNREVSGRAYMLQSFLHKPIWPNGFIASQRRSWWHIGFILTQPISGIVYQLLGGRKVIG